MTLIRITPQYFKRWHFLIVGLLVLGLFLRVHSSLPPTASEADQLLPSETRHILPLYLDFFSTPQDPNRLFISRFAVALLALLGVAAAYGVGKLLMNSHAAILALLLVVTLPAGFFFERTAQPATLASSGFMLVTLAVLYWVKQPDFRQAFGVGVLLLLTTQLAAGSMGVLVLPFVAVLLLRPQHWQNYLRSGVVVVGFGILASLLYPSAAFDNTLNPSQELLQPAITYLGVVVVVLALAVWGALLVRRTQTALFLLAGLILAWLPPLFLGQDQHLSAGMIFILLTLILGLREFSEIFEEYERKAAVQRAILLGCMVYSLAWGITFFEKAARDPLSLPLTDADQWAYIEGYEAGYGVQAAAAYLAAEDDARIVGVLRACPVLRFFLMDADVVCGAASDVVFWVIDQDQHAQLPDGAVWVQTFPRPAARTAIEIWRLP